MAFQRELPKSYWHSGERVPGGVTSPHCGSGSRTASETKANPIQPTVYCSYSCQFLAAEFYNGCQYSSLNTLCSAISAVALHVSGMTRKKVVEIRL